ncbi:MAG: beta-ketoacyl-ACP synthase III [Proteobacteria bacterium]|nr:beta-ketoacyl-ACP synthase III [Pseudomonadota bacterium]MBU1686381.1 beta-ketoacyl-ACP synthase III [Pseudomonadota bacterium]
MNNVFIQDIASFLPNDPVDNNQMEEILGMVNQLPSRTRKIILRNNRIKTRYYAIDPATGQTTHTNAELAAEAARRLTPSGPISCLCCGTAAPDLLMPGHASMVHAALGNPPCEIVSTAGICLAGITALKYGAMAVALGQHGQAVSTGSEQASSFMRAKFCGPVNPERAEALPHQPALSFEADFLRWMLSDGAGAVLLGNTPRPDRLNLRIDWIEIVSHADSMDTCMYAGGVKEKDGSIKAWREFSSLTEAAERGAFLVKQDAKLLNSQVVPAVVTRSLPGIIKKHNLHPEDVTWFLPHYSSDYFRMIVHDHLAAIDFAIPLDRWFTNLEEKGNTGSASIYIILEELFKSDQLNKGDTILCFIPESGRFSVGYIMLTAV